MSYPFVKLKLTQAWKCLGKGDPAEARREVEEALNSEGKSAPLLALLSEIERRQGNEKDAYALSQEVLEEFGPEHVAFSVLGKIALAHNKPEEALARFQEAYRLRRTSYYAACIVDAFEALKDIGAGSQFLSDALQLFPGDRRLLKRAARFYNRWGKDREALESVKELLRIDPGDEWANRMQVELKSRAKDPEDVRNLLEIGERKRDPKMRGLYAKKLRSAGDFQGAAKQFAEAAKLAPGNPYWRKQAGFAYARARLDEAAVSYLRPLFLSEPQDMYVRNALFAALRRQAGNEKVLEAIDQALAQHPDKGFLYGLKKKYMR